MKNKGKNLVYNYPLVTQVILTGISWFCPIIEASRSAVQYHHHMGLGERLNFFKGFSLFNYMVWGGWGGVEKGLEWTRRGTINQMSRKAETQETGNSPQIEQGGRREGAGEGLHWEWEGILFSHLYCRVKASETMIYLASAWTCGRELTTSQGKVLG